MEQVVFKIDWPLSPGAHCSLRYCSVLETFSLVYLFPCVSGCFTARIARRKGSLGFIVRAEVFVQDADPDARYKRLTELS